MSNFSLKSFHFYTLKPEPYKVMGEGHKSVEMRLNDEKRQLLKVDDFIIFTNREDKNKSLLTTIKDLKQYPSLDLYFLKICNNKR